MKESLVIFILLLLFAPLFVFAQAQEGEKEGLIPCGTENDPCDACDFWQMLLNLYNLLLGLAGIVAVIFMVVNGFQYVVAVGDEEMIGKAKEGLKKAIIGLLLIGASYVIINTILVAMQFNLDGEAKWGSVPCVEKAGWKNPEQGGNKR